VLGVVLGAMPHLFRWELLIETAVIGVLGFTLPLFLTLVVIQRVPIRSFAILLFLFPALTFIFSAALGYAHLYASDILAAGVIIAGVALHEFAKPAAVAR